MQAPIYCLDYGECYATFCGRIFGAKSALHQCVSNTDRRASLYTLLRNISASVRTLVRYLAAFFGAKTRAKREHH